MSLIVKLAENGNPGTPGRDKITMKATIESPLSIKRSPIIIPLPGGTIVGLDLGRNVASISITGVVDTHLTELFIKNKAGAAFVSGETITGVSGWNSLVSPRRSSTPTATIVAGYPNLVAPTTLMISALEPMNEFFVDNETITGSISGGTALVNEPLPTKRRFEQISRFWFRSGMLTLTSSYGTYRGFIGGMEFTLEAGIEDRYRFKLSFLEATQTLTEPV